MKKTTHLLGGNNGVSHAEQSESKALDLNPENTFNLSNSQKFLSMSKFIVKEMENLSALEKEQLEKLESVNFSDFDASNDTHRNYINFLVEKMKSYKEYTAMHLKTTDNSGAKKYKNMLSTYCDILDIPKNNFNLD